ncbi:MAG TPA: hypothetical protein VE690_17100 [Rhodopila sp.]|nr:hypothetical protein [Rhodopila sp.]
MTRRSAGTLAALVLVVLAGCAVRAPPGGDYRKVSELVRFPDFYPGLGTLYVQPQTLPYGPFRAYDRAGVLVSTIYMIPVRALNPDTMIGPLQGTPVRVDHAEIHYTSGHPGVAEPHYHIILWHVSPERAANLK